MDTLLCFRTHDLLRIPPEEGFVKQFFNFFLRFFLRSVLPQAEKGRHISPAPPAAPVGKQQIFITAGTQIRHKNVLLLYSGLQQDSFIDFLQV